jgi:RNA polymerase sigma-70 factor (ECF subfamily)
MNAGGVAHLETEDAQLVRRIVADSTGAFEELYDRYYGRAYLVARSVCREDGLAEEAVQEAFMAVWRTAGAYTEQRGAVANWLMSVVRYRAIDAARRNGKHANRRAEETRIEFHNAPGDVADRVEGRDRAKRLNALLGQLPDAQQEVIGLAFYGELTHLEIAAKLGLPAGTVKGRMRLGFQKLRADINEADASERWRVALTFAFYAGELAQARRIVGDAANAMPTVTMLDDVLAPAMHNIGALWQRNEITVADEQHATATAHQLLAGITSALTVAEANTRANILLLAPEPERHTFALLMAEEVLSGAGYRTTLLASGVPEATLKAALLRHRPAIVAVSSSMHLGGALAATANIVHDTLPSTQLIAGGPRAHDLPPNIRTHQIERLDQMLVTVERLLDRHA